MYGLVKSNNFAFNKIDKIKYIIFKQSFYTELFSQFVKSQIPEAKFIHIQRDPIARYNSAKQRRIVKKGQSLSCFNRQNFVLSHSIIDAASNYLAKENYNSIGSQNYRILQYENMVSNSRSVFNKIYSFLAIEKVQTPVPTILGNTNIAGSRFVAKKAK